MRFPRCGTLFTYGKAEVISLLFIVIMGRIIGILFSLVKGGAGGKYRGHEYNARACPARSCLPLENRLEARVLSDGE